MTQTGERNRFSLSGAMLQLQLSWFGEPLA